MKTVAALLVVPLLALAQESEGARSPEVPAAPAASVPEAALPVLAPAPQPSPPRSQPPTEPAATEAAAPPSPVPAAEPASAEAAAAPAPGADTAAPPAPAADAAAAAPPAEPEPPSPVAAPTPPEPPSPVAAPTPPEPPSPVAAPEPAAEPEPAVAADPAPPVEEPTAEPPTPSHVPGGPAEAAAPPPPPPSPEAAVPPPQPEPARYLPPPQGEPPAPPHAAPALIAPPAAAPAAPAPPAGVAPGRPAPHPYAPTQVRDSWYIGFGVGAGDGTVTTPRGSSSFRDLVGSPATNVFLNFKVGATVTPSLLVGLDVTATSSAADASGDASSVAVSNVDVALTWFPVQRGFFVRAGAGRSALVLKQSFPAATGTTRVEVRANGFNVMGGLGYAFWLGKSFNLTLNADASRQTYSGTPEGSTFWSVWAGFDWY